MILLLIGLIALLCILMAKRRICEYYADKFYDPEYEDVMTVIRKGAK